MGRKSNMNFCAIWCRIFVAFLVIFTVISIGAARTEAGDHGGEVEEQPTSILGDHAALLYTGTLIAPQFYKKKLVHHVFYEFALLVDADQWNDVKTGKMRLREALLSELNRKTFTLSGAPTRINIPLLKKHLLARARKLFGQESILSIYVLNALPRKM